MTNAIEQRYLPVSDDQGLLGDAHLTILAYMAKPDDILGASSAVKLFQSELEFGFLTTTSKVVEDDMVSRWPIFQLCGNVAWQMVLNSLEGGGPSLRKAVYVVSELEANSKTRDGKPMPTSPGRLKEHVRIARDVLHLWLAFNQSGENVKAGLLTGNRNSVDEFLCLAAFAEAALASQQVFPDWNPWLVPDRHHEMVLTGKYSVKVPPIPSIIKDKMGEYRRGG